MKKPSLTKSNRIKPTLRVITDRDEIARVVEERLEEVEELQHQLEADHNDGENEGVVFAALTIDEEARMCDVYLVNPTKQNYARAIILSGGDLTDEDSTIHTSNVLRGFHLPKNSCRRIDSLDFDYSLEFSVWFQVDLCKTADMQSSLFQFHLPKAYQLHEVKTEIIPVLEKEGVKIEMSESARRSIVDYLGSADLKDSVSYLSEDEPGLDLQEKINKAWELKKEGDLVKALKLYREIHDELVDVAAERARQIPGTRTDEGETRKIMPTFFTEADKCLRQDKVFCTILNNMGVIYAETGDNISARGCFEEAIKFTPEGMGFPNPKIGLKELE